MSEILDTLERAASGLDNLQTATSGLTEGEMYGVIIGAVLTVLMILVSAFLIFKFCRRRCKYILLGTHSSSKRNLTMKITSSSR